MLPKQSAYSSYSNKLYSIFSFYTSKTASKCTHMHTYIKASVLCTCISMYVTAMETTIKLLHVVFAGFCVVCTVTIEAILNSKVLNTVTNVVSTLSHNGSAYASAISFHMRRSFSEHLQN